jgi:hypothetical protein
MFLRILTFSDPPEVPRKSEGKKRNTFSTDGKSPVSRPVDTSRRIAMHTQRHTPAIYC